MWFPTLSDEGVESFRVLVKKQHGIELEGERLRDVAYRVFIIAYLAEFGRDYLRLDPERAERAVHRRRADAVAPLGPEAQPLPFPAEVTDGEPPLPHPGEEGEGLVRVRIRLED